MGELRKGGSVAWAVGIALTALLALYVGAYYAMVEPFELRMGQPTNRFTARYPIVEPRSGEWHPSRLRTLFEPIHQIDRIIRPRTWWRQYEIPPEFRE